MPDYNLTNMSNSNNLIEVTTSIIELFPFFGLIILIAACFIMFVAFKGVVTTDKSLLAAAFLGTIFGTLMHFLGWLGGFGGLVLSVLVVLTIVMSFVVYSLPDESN